MIKNRFINVTIECVYIRCYLAI